MMAGIPPDWTSVLFENAGSSAHGDSKCVPKFPGHAILIVEDDLLVQDVLVDIVSALGYPVLTADNGVEAISVFEQNCEAIACVILDFELPGLHSSSAFHRIREINGDVKILLSSGYPKSDIVNEFPFEIIDGFIPKPYDPQRLIEQLGRMFDS